MSILLIVVLAVDQWPQIRKRIRRATWTGVSELQLRGRLSARPHPPSLPPPPPGVSKLGLGDLRDGLLYVPASYRADRPARLLVMLHGSTGRGEKALRRWRELAEAHGFVVLAPDSRDYTWDATLYDQFGPDVAFIDRALTYVFDRVNVDPSQVVLGGFSDGASYALSLGLVNGDLFARVLSFSPGWFFEMPRPRDIPVFLAHGIEDDVLPIDEAGRPTVELLRREHIEVTYEEFHGGHEIRPEQQTHALAWLGWN